MAQDNRGILAQYPHLKDSLNPVKKRDVWRMRGRQLEPEVGEDFEPIDEPEEIPIGSDFEPIEPSLGVERYTKPLVPYKDTPQGQAPVPKEPEEITMWDKIWEPTTTVPSQIAKRLSGSEGNNPFSIQNLRKNVQHEGLASGLGFLEGVVEGTGDVLSQMSAPGDAIPTLLGLGAWRSGARGLSALARALTWGERATSWPAAIHGGQTISDPNASWAEKAFGLAELAGGTAGTFSPMPPRGQATPTPEPTPTNFDDIVDLIDFETGQVITPTPESGGVPPPPPPNDGGMPTQPSLPLERTPWRSIPETNPLPPRRPHGVGPDDVIPDGYRRDARLDQAARERYPQDSVENLIKRLGDSLGGLDTTRPNEANIFGNNQQIPLFENPAIIPFSRGLDEFGNRAAIDEGFVDRSGEPLPPDESRLPFDEEISFDEGPAFGEEPNFAQQRLDEVAGYVPPGAPNRALPRAALSNIADAVARPEGPQASPLPPEFDFNARQNTALEEPPPADLFAPREGWDTPSKPELLEPEPELDIFGYPKNRDMTPKEVQEAMRVIRAQESQFFGPDNIENQARMDDMDGTIDSMSKETEQWVNESIQAQNEGYTVLPEEALTPARKQEYKPVLNADGTPRRLSDGSYVVELRNAVKDFFKDESGTFNPDSILDLFGDNVSRTIDERGRLKFGLGDPKAVIDIFRNTYRGSVPMVAGKEMLQNALDATMHNPKGRIDVDINEFDNTVRVIDNGPGMSREMLENEFTNLASSGKRGLGDTIGEMGVGKTTYLLTGEKVSVQSTVRNADGRLETHSFEATPEQLLGEGVDIKTTYPLEGTETGTLVEVKVGKDESVTPLKNYLDNLKEYSQVKTPINIRTTRRGYLDVNKRFTDETIIDKKDLTEPGDIVFQGESTGSKYTISIPKTATTGEHSRISLILVNRGMFQGVDNIWLGQKAALPDRLVVELDPIVDATHKDYPLTVPTRESLRGPTKRLVEQHVLDELVKGAATKRQEELGRMFDQMMAPRPGQKLVLVDSQAKYTGEEVSKIANSPQLTAILKILNESILPEFLQNFKPRMVGELTSVGYILDDKVRGVNVMKPGGKAMSVLLEPISILERTPKGAANGFVHIFMHELAHTIARNEGADFTATLADMYEQIDLGRQAIAKQRIESILTADRGTYTQQIQELLRIGKEARGREGTARNVIVDEGGSKSTSSNGPSKTGSNVGPDGSGTPPKRIAIKVGNTAAIKRAMEQGYEYHGELPGGRHEYRYTGKKTKTPILEEQVKDRVRPRDERAQLGVLTDVKKASPWWEAYNLPRGIMAAWDASAPFRQGLGLIHKKEFWQNLRPMFQALRSEDAFQALQKSITDKALFKPRKNPKYNPLNPKSREYLPSFAEEAGLALTDLKSLSTREEAIMSTWAERFPFVRASNRAYTAFLNKTRADVFESLIENLKVVDRGNEFGANAKVNVPLARELAQFVNTATGRGSLGKLEQHANLLNKLLFSPRLIASRVRMLNPATYIMASAPVRKEYLKSVIAMTMVGTTLNELLSFGGVTEPVEHDPRSTDFGKVRIGDTRFDPYGGLQQYIVKAVQSLIYVSNKSNALNKIMISPMTGLSQPDTIPEVKSSTTGNKYELGKKWGRRDAFENLLDFGIGKTHPVLNFAINFAKGKTMDGRDFNVTQEVANRFIPIIMQDVMELTTENPEWFSDVVKNQELPDVTRAPEKLPLVIPEFFGVGMQNYGKPSKLW